LQSFQQSREIAQKRAFAINGASRQSCAISANLPGAQLSGAAHDVQFSGHALADLTGAQVVYRTP